MASRCFRCKEASGTILSRDGPKALYCEDCFTSFCTKTVRENLTTQCHIPSDVPLVVAVSGGPSSMMLLHQLGMLRSQGRLRGGKGKLNYVVLPFFLDESALIMPPLWNSVGEGLDRRTQLLHAARTSVQDQCALLAKFVEQQPQRWDFAGVPLYSAGEVRQFSYHDFFSDDKLTDVAAFLHHPKRSLTEREALYARVQQRVFTTAATRMVQEWWMSSTTEVKDTQHNPEWTHLLVGDNAAVAATAVLQSIVEGGGSNDVVHATAFRGMLSHNAHGVMVLRPMRTLLPKEVLLYNRLHGIVGSYSPALSTGSSLRSIRRCLETFIHSMQTSYRSSIFNCLNLGQKLCVGPDCIEECVRCRCNNEINKGHSAVQHHALMQQWEPPRFTGLEGEDPTTEKRVPACRLCGKPNTDEGLSVVQSVDMATSCCGVSPTYRICIACSMLLQPLLQPSTASNGILNEVADDVAPELRKAVRAMQGVGQCTVPSFTAKVLKECLIPVDEEDDE